MIFPQLGFSNDAFIKNGVGKVAQTSDVTPTVIYSYPLAEQKVVQIEAFIVCLETTYAAGASAKVEGVFYRRTGESVGRSGSLLTTLLTTSFLNPQPAFTLVANTQNNTVDVQITGKAGVNLIWYVDLNIRETV